MLADFVFSAYDVQALPLPWPLSAAFRWLGPRGRSSFLAIGKRAVGTKRRIIACFQARQLAGMERTRRAMRTLRQHSGAGGGLDARHCRRMVAMRVGDKDMRDGFALHGRKQCRDMRVVERARQAAATNADILIEAESGTGKELWHV